MKKFLFKFALVIVLFGGFTFSACKNDSDVQPEEMTVEDNNTGLNESEDIVSMSDDVFAQNSSSLRQSTEGKTYYGATVTIIPKGANETGQVIIDFGTTGIKGRDGRTRTGKIIITYSDMLPISGATRTFTFENYYVNNNHIEGTKTVEFNNSSSNGIYTAKITSNLAITTNAGQMITWNSSRTRVLDTQNTSTFNDDEVSISGTASGVSRNGVSYTVAISTPIIIKATCLSTSGWIPTSGILEVAPTNALVRTVNYGAGDCDRKANISVGNKSFDITIR